MALLVLEKLEGPGHLLVLGLSGEEQVGADWELVLAANGSKERSNPKEPLGFEMLVRYAVLREHFLQVNPPKVMHWSDFVQEKQDLMLKQVSGEWPNFEEVVQLGWARLPKLQDLESRSLMFRDLCFGYQP